MHGGRTKRSIDPMQDSLTDTHQRHTYQGERGAARVEGLNLRELHDIVCKEYEHLEQHQRLSADALASLVCLSVEKTMGLFPNIPQARSAH